MTDPYYEDDAVTLWHSDCLDVMRQMPNNSVDAVVTDPPAGIAFMGRAWDGDKGGREKWSAWLAEIMAEALRVTKPGGHAFVWALPRTAHWTACGLEDAGWEIRDRVVHLFGTGFPKSKNLGEGRGTALKPAAEDWWLCRKPVEGSTTANVLAHGTGALNVDGCRVGSGEDRVSGGRGINRDGDPSWRFSNRSERPTGGRWPTNVVMDGNAAAEVGEESRFFPVFKYQAKAPARERVSYVKEGEGVGFLASSNKRCTKCGKQKANMPGSMCVCSEPDFQPEQTHAGKVAHPTVKPLALMRWLVRLVTPPGGVVLDPFAGSGTTIEAAILEGFQVIGIEREADYLPLIEARIARATPEPASPVVPVICAEGNGRDGEASAERRYTDKGGSNFAMKPGRRYDRPTPSAAAAEALALFDFEEPA